MKHSFRFDKASGTMVPDSAAVEQGLKANVNQEVREVRNEPVPPKPEFKEEGGIDIPKPKTANTEDNRVVQMKRVDKMSAVQLVDENGVPEAYLDSITTGVLMFRERQDYSIVQIADKRNGKILAYIGGYALQVRFNMSELNTMEKIEQCLEGLKKYFRHQIMHQQLGK